MASSQCPTDRNFIVVDFHYIRTFAPYPLVYFDPGRTSVAFEYEEFMEFLHKLTRRRSKDIYFCLTQESLSQGIHTLLNEGDYKEFLDLAYANERRMNVYVDHQNEPIFEWIDEEENEDKDYNCEEDEESVLLDIYFVDHKEDDVEYPFPANKTMGDRFLNKLCLRTVNVDDVDEDDEYVEPQYPVHVDRQPWNQMKPLLGMRFSNLDKLKNMLRTMQLLMGVIFDSEHTCSRLFKFGSIVTYKWIGKQFMSEIIEKPKMSVRKMKVKVSTTFNINVSNVVSDGWKEEFYHSTYVFIALYRLWGVTPCGYQKYEVGFNDASYRVDLIAKTCSCRIWQLTGITFLHGVAAISSLNQDAETYSKEAYLKCYNYSINPLNGSDMWQEVPYHKPLPPKRRRLPIRHSVIRMGTLIRCSVCKEPAHNKKKCPSKQQTNTSAPSSSRGSGAGPSPPATTVTTQPPPPPPEAAQQPPPLPASAA
uniref:SWIM-type domain-containing protein n=1 Tax=Lactuca sativa TaxID=4236 RepID=A0A9R1XS29_LACSA|nr:hypothetical protein LSAT_V11C300130830 [Lactuca sativa]